MNFENDYLAENKPISVNLTENTKTTKQENNSEFIDNRPEAIEVRKLQEAANNSPKTLENQKMQKLWQDIIDENQEQIQKASKIQAIFEKSEEASLPDLKNAMEKTPIAKNIEQQ